MTTYALPPVETSGFPGDDPGAMSVPDVIPEWMTTEAIRPDQERPEALQLLDRFFRTRELAQAFPGARGDDLEVIRDGVAAWFEDRFPGMALSPGTLEEYTRDVEPGHTMLDELIAYLRDNHGGDSGVTFPELIASQDFLDATNAVNDALKKGEDLSEGVKTHAFVVPVRLSTDHPEYSREIHSLIPAFRYVPDHLVPYFMRDFRTFVADRYKQGGYVVVAPVTTDMKKDVSGVSLRDFLSLGRQYVNEAVDIAHMLGAVDVGYGATYPGLMGLGRETRNQNVQTTTGHGGTTALMVMLAQKVAAELLHGKKDPRLGVLGLGQIGLPAAQVAADFFPESHISVFDPVSARTEELTRTDSERRFAIAQNVAEVIANSDIIFSTATSTFDFVNPESPNYVKVETLKGKIFIDDAEPHSILHEQVLALGGIVLDVVGRDYSGEVLIRDTDFGYGGTLADTRQDAFGCELEAGTNAYLRRRAEAEGMSPEEASELVGRYALNRRVTAEDTRRWIQVFQELNIGPAPLQVFGHYYEQPSTKLLPRMLAAAGRLVPPRYRRVKLPKLAS